MIAINILSLAIFIYVLILALHNYFRFKMVNGANFTRLLFIGQIIALMGVSFCLLISIFTWSLLIASILMMYLAIMSMIFYKQ